MMFFLFVASLFALAASQDCSPQGHTYKSEEGQSITFGDDIGLWIPFIYNTGSEVFYLTMKRTIEGDKTSSWDIKEWANPGSKTLCGPSFPVGVYTAEFSEDCASLSFASQSDRLCPSRVAYLESTYDVQEGECHSAGTFIKGQFAESDLDPSFSAKAAHIAYGEGGYTIVTAHDIAVFQMWSQSVVEEQDVITIVDIMSIPHGHTCKAELQGVYHGMKSTDSSCGVQTCGVEDPCEGRRDLWNGAKFNAYRGDKCTTSHGAGSAVNPVFGECSDGRNWRRDPDECFNQIIAGGCVYCEGIIDQNSFSYCITRQSKDCRVLFEEVGVQAYCNLAYECTDLGFEIGAAGSMVASVAVILAALLSLLA